MSDEPESKALRDEVWWLQALGWYWVGERLTHPKNPATWRAYDFAGNVRTLAPWYADIRRQLDDRAEQAAREARALVRRRRGG